MTSGLLALQSKTTHIYLYGHEVCIVKLLLVSITLYLVLIHYINAEGVAGQVNSVR